MSGIAKRETDWKGKWLPFGKRILAKYTIQNWFTLQATQLSCCSSTDGAPEIEAVGAPRGNTAYTTVAYAESVDRIRQIPYPVNGCFTEEFDVLDQEDANALLDEKL